VAIFKTMLKKLIEDTSLKEWELFIPWIQLYMNSRIHEKTGSTPFSLMLGRSQNSWKNYRNIPINPLIWNEVEMSTLLNRHWKEMFIVIYPIIAKKVTAANTDMKKQFDKSHRL